MERNFLIKLTLALYRVTELFPKEEPLKFSIREKANEILADLVCKEQKTGVGKQVLNNIKVLEGYFEVAEKQKWVKEVNFFVLKREYGKIESEIGKDTAKSDSKEKKEALEGIEEKKLRNERYNKILEALKEKEMAQVKDFKEIFPEISKRTLRRDFDYLLGQGLVERLGNGRTTLYKLK